jgi:hypothetical protein
MYLHLQFFPHLDVVYVNRFLQVMYFMLHIFLNCYRLCISMLCNFSDLLQVIDFACNAETQANGGETISKTI